MVLRFFVRIAAFLRKEIVNILRQPRLILTLVLGPFLILFVFGIGFRSEAQPLHTLFVVGEENPLRPYVEQYATRLGPQLVYEGATGDFNAAMNALRQGEVDDVVFVPRDALQTIESGAQVIFEVYHNEIEPTEVGYVEFAMDIYVDELNRRVLTEIYEDRRGQAFEMREDIEEAQQALDATQQALEEDNVRQAQEGLGALALALEQAQATDPRTDESNTSTPMTNTTWLSQTLGLLSLLQSDTQNLRETELENSESYSETLTRVENNLQQVDALLATVEELPAPVALSPFEIEITSISPVEIEMIDFYTPGVIALLLQHLSVTFAALSIVQEEKLGSFELFQVAPLSPFEMLVGKYLSFTFFSAVIAALLSLLVLYVLNVPMIGSWTFYSLTLLGLILTSLGLGFLISLLSQTTSQAVQASMILLLASVFFTGFFQGLEFFASWVQVISWSLPATYGLQLLQDVMLRARGMEPLLVIGLTIMATLMFIVNWALLRSRMVRE